MSSKSRKIGRAALVGLLMSAAPVASAVGQEANLAPQPALVTTGTMPQVEPFVGPIDPILQDGASALTAAAGDEVDAARERLEAKSREAAEIETKAAALKPGTYLWMPERAAGGRVEMVVSLAEQKAYVYRGGELMAVTTVSTGKKGHRTPTGSFEILQKRRKHFSNLYNNAPMPNMQRLTWDGIALHAGALPGYPASHGCVRLPMAFSKLLFEVTQLGGRVHIVAKTPPTAAGALAFAAGGGGMEMASAG